MVPCPRRLSTCLALAATLGVACPKDGDPPPDTDSHDTSPTEGCVEDADLLAGVAWEVVTEVPSVIRVQWTLPEPAPARVRFQVPADGAWLETALVPAGEAGVALLAGAGHDATVPYQLVVGEEGAQVCSPVAEAITGAALPDLPAFELLAGGEEPAVDGFLMTEIAAGGSWAAILDGQGRYRWAMQGTRSMPRLLLHPDGRGLMYIERAVPEEGFVGGVVLVGFDGEVIERYPFADPEIDFVVLADGRPVVLVEDIRPIEHDGVVHDIQGQALEVWNPEEGVAERLWSVFDLTQPDFSTTYPLVTTLNGNVAEDWSHINGISYDENANAYLLSVGSLHAVIAVDATTGETLWTLADTWGDWAVDGASSPLVQMPHSTQGFANGNLLVFNRYTDPAACSDVTEVAFDQGTRTASRVWSATTQDCLHVHTLGNAVRVEDGSTLVSWSSAGRIDVLQPDGVPTLSLGLPLGSFFGYVVPVPTLYPGGDAD